MGVAQVNQDGETGLVIATRGLLGLPLLANSACQGNEDEHVEGDPYEAESQERGLARRDGTGYESH